MNHGSEHSPIEHAIQAGHPAAGTTQPYFSDAEWQTLRKEDISAATAIVILMQSIFAIGLVMYIIVAWSVAS
jgi:hypothetical protein